MEKFTIQTLLRDHRGENPRWVTQSIARDMAHGLSVASHGCPVYQCRIWDGEQFYTLDWFDDEDNYLCFPTWVEWR